MTDYSPKAITVDGVAPTINNAAAGDKLLGASDRSFLNVNNGSGVSVTLTITVPGSTGYNVTNPVKTFTIGAGTQMDIPILAAYSNPADQNRVALSWSATTTVTHSYKRI